jgi:hypothetical protein
MISQKLAGQLIKGLYSAVVAFLGGLSTILVGSTTFSDVESGQWVALAFAAVIAFGGTLGLSGWAGPVVGTTANKPGDNG